MPIISTILITISKQSTCSVNHREYIFLSNNDHVDVASDDDNDDDDDDDDDDDGLAIEKRNLSVSVAVQLAPADCYLFDLRPHFHLPRYFF